MKKIIAHPGGVSRSGGLPLLVLLVAPLGVALVQSREKSRERRSKSERRVVHACYFVR